MHIGAQQQQQASPSPPSSGCIASPSLSCIMLSSWRKSPLTGARGASPCCRGRRDYIRRELGGALSATAAAGAVGTA